MSTNPRTRPAAPAPGTADPTTPTTTRDQASQPPQHGGTGRTFVAGAWPARAARRQAGPAAAALRPVPGQGPPRDRIDAGGTRLRLRALHVMGHGSARIARALGVRETAIRDLVRGDTATVSPQLRDAVTSLYDTWWDKRAPASTPAERGAATAARKRAIAGNWCAAAALDDDQLDVPGYRPRQGWKPAAGTGTAPDIRPPARHHRRKGA